MLFQELNVKDKYDGIWACASILHLKKTELPGVLRHMCEAIKKDRIIYISFKYSDFEGQREGRYFTELTEKSSNELLKTVPELKKEKQCITGDMRIGRGNERWINMIFRK